MEAFCLPIPVGRTSHRGRSICGCDLQRGRVHKAAAHGLRVYASDELSRTAQDVGKDAEPARTSEEPSQGAEPQAQNAPSGRSLLDALRQVHTYETSLADPSNLKMSHEMIRFDENGEAPVDRFVYVEERDCIGCTHCATTAAATFYLEPEYGRARAFNQLGDSEKVIEEAVSLLRIATLLAARVRNSCGLPCGFAPCLSSDCGTFWS